jgi:cation-transporting ATPase 13A2
MQLNKKIFNMAYYEVKINVLREGKIEEISSIDAVPGDIVFLKEAIKIPFEGIILEGSALINECALTGESVPVVKKADTFDRMANKANAIDKNAFVFEGTTIIQVNDKKKMAVFESFREKYGIPVCVVKTNFVTTKGQLVRIILFPKEQENIFQKESTKYLFFLFCLALAAFIALIIMIHSYADFVELFQKFIDLITITVPPALPVSMTFGIIYAIEKLEKKKIFCISQNKVIVGGMIEFCCFDKTGTLTEDYMDFYALAPANEGKFFPAVINNEVNAKKFI